MFEVFEHTADVGLRIRAADVNGLFRDAAEALFAVIVGDPGTIRPEREFEFRVAAEAHEELLHDWLAELLYTFDVRHVVLRDFKVEVGAVSLAAWARGEPIDPKRHPIDREVKAITYHALKIERVPDGWLAEVILDL